MTNEDKATEIARHIIETYADINKDNLPNALWFAAINMAEYKEQQMIELWNVARNVYEAWMGGTMNDVRECMRDLGHVYDEFKDKGWY